jgi:GGDEF domain-containing protein
METTAEAYELGFLASDGFASGDGTRVLLCDPLTRLIGYPSFQQFVTDELPTLAREGVHVAIGDVDDLKRFVSDRRAGDPTMFGHLAGNDCMQRLGAATLEWAEAELVDWPFALCGTFGGDEVIVVTSGGPYASFVSSIEQLAERIKKAVPRSCSFALGTTRSKIPSAQAPLAYRSLVARIDAALFDCKESLRARGVDPAGELVDVGFVSLELPEA